MPATVEDRPRLIPDSGLAALPEAPRTDLPPVVSEQVAAGLLRTAKVLLDSPAGRLTRTVLLRVAALPRPG